MADCLNRLYERKNLAFIVPRKIAKHFESSRKVQIFCFSESESFSKITRSFTLIRPNNFLLNKINIFIQQAMEMGYLQKLQIDKDKIYEEHFDGPIVLTLQHVAGHMLVYLVGNILAVLSFIGERMACKYMTRNNSGAWKWLDKYFLSPERVICIHTKENRDQEQ